MSAIFLLHKIRAIVLFILSSLSLLLGTYNNDDNDNNNNKVRGEYKNHRHYTEGNYIYYNVV